MRPFSFMTKRFEIDPRLKKIADHYGFDAQAEKTIEEMAELIVAIKNLKKFDGCEADHLVNFFEELADVKIMVDQLIYLHNKTAGQSSSLNHHAHKAGTMCRPFPGIHYHCLHLP